MTVIEASSAGVRDMADGSLRITFEFEPRHAKDAYTLFGARGAPVAIAALKTGAVAPSEPVPEAPKGGPLSEWVALRCKDPAFRVWLAKAGPCGTDPGEEWAAEHIRSICGVESRASIDHSPFSVDLMRERVIEPWKKHCSSKAASGL